MKVDTLQSLAAAVESIATVAALAAAGWWTFLLFIKKREKYPRVKTTHNVVPLGRFDGYRFLRISVKVENLGSVLVDLCRGKVLVQAVRPLPNDWKALILRGEDLSTVDGREFAWPCLKEFPLEWGKDGYRIEPLESEEFHFDIVVTSSLEAIQIYSYFQNVTERRRELGWNCTTVKNLPTGDVRAEQAPNSPNPNAQATGSSEAPQPSGATKGHYN